MPAPEPEVVPQAPAEAAADAPRPLPQQVSTRSTKGVLPGRYSPSFFMIIFIIIYLLLSGVSASPVSPWGAEAIGELIIENSILWHVWENVVLLQDYQFLIVSLKILPPKTTAGKYLCGSSYNSTDVTALAWYLEWEREIEILTRFLKFLELNFTRDHLNVRSRRSTVNSQQSFPIISLKKFQQNISDPILSNRSISVQILKQTVNEENLQLNSQNQDLALSNRAQIALGLCTQNL